MNPMSSHNMRAASSHPNVSEEDLADAIKQIIHLREVNITLVGEIDGIKQEHADTCRNFEQSKADHAATSKKMIQALSKQSLLKDETEETKKMLQDALTKVDHAEQNHAIVTSEKEALAIQLESVQFDLDILKRQATNAQNAIDDRDAKILELRTQINNVHAAKGNDVSELAKLELALNAAKADVHTFINELNQAKLEMAELTAQCSASSAEVATYKSRLESEVSKSDALDKELRKVRDNDLAEAVKGETTRKVEVEILSKQQEKLQEQNSMMSDELHQAKMTVAEYKIKLDHVEQQVKSLTKDLAESASKLDFVHANHEKEIANLKAALAAEETVSKEARDSVTSLQSKINQMEMQLASVTTEHGDSASKLSQAQLDLAEMKDKLASLTESLVAKNADLAASEEQKASLSTNVNSARATIIEITEKLNRSEELFTEMEKKYTNANEELQSTKLQLQNEGSSANEAMQRMEKQISDMRTEISASEQKVIELTTSADEAAAHASKKAHAAAVELERLKVESESMLNAIKAENSSLEKEKENLAGQLNGAQSKTEDLVRTVEVLENSIKAKDRELTDIQESEQTAKEKLASMEKEIELGAGKLAAIESERDKLQEDMAGLSANSQNLSDELEENKTVVKELLEKEHNALASAEKLSFELASANDQLIVCNEKISELEAVNSKNQEELSEIKTKLKASDLEIKSMEELNYTRKKQFDSLLADANKRATRFEESLASTCEETKTSEEKHHAQIAELKQDIDSRSSDIDQLKMSIRKAEEEKAGVDTKLVEMIERSNALEQQLANTAAAMEQLRANAERTYTELQEALMAKEQLETAFEAAKAELNEHGASFSNLGAMLEQQTEDNDKLVERLDAAKAAAKDTEQLNVELTTEVENLKEQIERNAIEMQESKEANASALQTQASEYENMLGQVRLEALQQQQEEEERHAASHQQLVSMLEPLKQELAVLGRSKFELNKEVQDQAAQLLTVNENLNSVTTSLKSSQTDVERLRSENQSTTEKLNAATNELEPLRAEAALLREKIKQKQGSQSIASTLGSDTVLMQKLQEVQQENAKLRKAGGGRGGIQDKLKLATATAQLSKLKEALEAKEAELTAAKSEIASLKTA